MRLYRPCVNRIRLCIALLIAPWLAWSVAAKDFVLVIDAGHGGHDPGAIGRISKEKNINLNVALKLGRMVEQNCPDVKVIYTRKKDVFVALDRRAEIANNAKADLFISIHTNALAKNKTTRGASTWTLGLAKSDENLDVAKRENSVILYENDYRTRYAGFNPNSAESYIIFEFMQDKYMSQSVHLASLVQQHFRNTCKRTDRGVHQAGFLVLKASAMPSILVELGFISTPDEEKFLNTEDGTSSLAKGIFNAFLTYKREQAIRMDGEKALPEPQTVEGKVEAPTVVDEQERPATDEPPLVIADRPVVTEQAAADEPERKPEAASKQGQKAESRPAGQKAGEGEQPVFKVQILTASRPLVKNDKRLKGLQGAEYYQEGGLYKYTYGASTDYNQVLRTRRTLTARFKDAFIIAFKGGKKVNVNEAIAEFKRNRNK